MNKIALAALVTVIFAAPGSCLTPPEIPVSLKHDKTLIDMSVNGVEVPEIILDTGFPYDGVLIYNPDVRNKLDLSGADEARIGGAGSGKDSEAVVIRSGDVKAGGVRLPEQMVIVLKGDAFKGFPSSGAIGYSLFGHYLCELDYDRGVMVLHDPGFRPDESWAEMPIYFKENMVPWIDISVAVGGEKPVKLAAYIDFAASTPIVLIEKKGMKFRPPERTEEKILGRGLSGDVRARTCRVRKVIIGKHELQGLDAAVAPSSHSKQKDADAVLGCGALKHFNLILDYANRKIYLKRNVKFKGF